jgi:methanogenic corrinoid protein MtbC1
MTSATPIIEEEIKRRGTKRESLGTVVIGTVYGDIHSIGKTMVAVLLTADGFVVNDLGINVTAENFVEGVKRYSPDILAMSALMTMTAPEQKKVIATLKKEGLRDKVKIMVGGGAITQEFADSIGADGYDPTAPGALKLARRLIGK